MYVLARACECTLRARDYVCAHAPHEAHRKFRILLQTAKAVTARMYDDAVLLKRFRKGFSC